MWKRRTLKVIPSFLVVFSIQVLLYTELGVAATDDELLSTPQWSISALCDQTVRNYRLLTPKESDVSDVTKQQKNCVCNMIHQAPWGEPKIQIDCSALSLQSEHLRAENLPFGSQVLDISWNQLQRIPKFVQNVDQLQKYRLQNNHIEKIEEGDLHNMKHLTDFDLSNNAIASIANEAFQDVTALEHLNLGYNNLRSLPENIFRPLKNLLRLTLSGNDLNELLVEKNLFYNFQVNAESLQVLELEYCQLTWLSVESAVALKEIRLRGNSFFKQLPLLSPNIKLLDLSANPVRRLDAFYNGQLKDMEILLLEDMPNFYLIDTNALATFRSLRKISLQNSKNFTYLSESAFEAVQTEFEGDGEITGLAQLTEIILTGTNVRKLSEKLHNYISKVEVIALDGCPVVCDCDLKWLMGKRNGIMTNGICAKPLSARNKRIDEVQPEEMKNCSNFSRFMFKFLNGLLILFMIILCCVAMYFLVIGCRPSKKFYVRQRMGLNSPYSRITVEPIGQSYRPTTISQP